MAEALISYECAVTGRDYPSVEVYSPGTTRSELKLSIGSDKAWVATFEMAAAYSIVDECIAPTEHFNSLPRSGRGPVFLWCESPWLRELKESQSLIEAAYGPGELLHFVFLGGDNIVDVLSIEPPKFELAVRP
jgi:hypothetical protein